MHSLEVSRSRKTTKAQKKENIQEKELVPGFLCAAEVNPMAPGSGRLADGSRREEESLMPCNPVYSKPSPRRAGQQVSGAMKRAGVWTFRNVDRNGQKRPQNQRKAEIQRDV